MYCYYCGNPGKESGEGRRWRVCGLKVRRGRLSVRCSVRAKKHGGVGGASAPRVMKTWGIICDGMADPKVLPSIINTTRY